MQIQMEEQMATLLSKSIYGSTVARAVLLGLIAFCGASRPALGQETVAGKFKLAESTRFANKLLPAGTYTFSVEPAGTVQSISAIQGAWQPVVIVVRPESKAGRIAVILALASRTGHSIDASKLVLGPENDGMAIRAMYLDQQGLVLDLDWAHPKNKTQMLAQAGRPEAASSSKTTD